jgi:hypothetical protein
MRETARLCCRRFFLGHFCVLEAPRLCLSHSRENTMKLRLNRPPPPGRRLREQPLLNILPSGLDAGNALAGTQGLFDRPQLCFRTI